MFLSLTVSITGAESTFNHANTGLSRVVLCYVWIIGVNMIILQIGFTGLSLNNGKLFGQYGEHPIKTIKFLVVTITLLPSITSRLLMDALNGLALDRKWLVENSIEARIAKRKAFAKAKAQAESRVKATVKMYEQENDELHKRIAELARENDALKTVFSALGT